MDDRFFNECIARVEASKLKAMLRVVSKWEDVALAEVRSIEAADTSRMSEEQQHWHGEYLNDEHYMLDAVKNSLLAGLAVAIASTVEKFMGMLCAENSIPLSDRPTWGDKRTGVERLTGGVRLDTFGGFGSAKRARLLANCFKHNGGKTNQDWVDAYGGSVDDEIRYEDEDWDTIVEGTQTFLLEVVESLPPG